MRKAHLFPACCLLSAILLIGGKPDSENPLSLIKNGDFSQADSTDTNKPAYWDKPDELGIQWVNVPTSQEGTGQTKAIRMNTALSEKAMMDQWKKMGIEKWNIPHATDGPVGGTYGLSFYSDAISVRTGQAYRLTFKFKGKSGGAKVWIRGYGLLRGNERRLYDTIVTCRTKDDDWTAFSQAFHPTANTPDVTCIRVMLFAYWPPALYWFKDVAITPISQEEWKLEFSEN